MIVSMIIETIRKQIESCRKKGKTRYRIAKETGVGEDQLCRIVQGKTCTVETADILLKYFGLTIAKKKRSAKRKRPL
jgi:plasmid maintenance system antidote protein VapI